MKTAGNGVRSSTYPRLRSWVLLFRMLALALLLGTVFVALLHTALLRAIVVPTLIRYGVAQENAQVQDPLRLSYPEIGIEVPVVENPNTSPTQQTDWADIGAALRLGVSLAYEESSFQDASLAFITGHSSDTVRHPYESVFAGLGSARKDDQFTLVLHSESFEYRVIETKIIQPSAIDEFEALAPADGGHRLALVTCWPPLTTRSRLVVLAERL